MFTSTIRMNILESAVKKNAPSYVNKDKVGKSDYFEVKCMSTLFLCEHPCCGSVVVLVVFFFYSPSAR